MQDLKKDKSNLLPPNSLGATSGGILSPTYDCGGDGGSYGQMYSYWYLDKQKMNARSEVWVEQFPQKSIQNRKILSWGKKIVMENIKTASEPYFKNDELWMLGDGRLVSGWYSNPCKILEQN